LKTISDGILCPSRLLRQTPTLTCRMKNTHLAAPFAQGNRRVALILRSFSKPKRGQIVLAEGAGGFNPLEMGKNPRPSGPDRRTQRQIQLWYQAADESTPDKALPVRATVFSFFPQFAD